MKGQINLIITLTTLGNSQNQTHKTNCHIHVADINGRRDQKHAKQKLRDSTLKY